MDEKLLKRYREYARTDNARAVIFAKTHVAKAKGHWVDISSSRLYEMSPDNLHFRFVRGGLYTRKLHPQYPAKSICTINGKFDEREYYLMVRAITWETAHIDIAQQKALRIQPLKFEITGVSYDKNKDNKSYFKDDAPLEIKALALNLSDRTNPLWDKAAQYVMEPEYVYEVSQVRFF
jgi:hypothetical protein